MFSSLKDYTTQLDLNSISNDRKLVLQPLIDFVKAKHTNQQPIALNFICTHNSRRSHLSQIWAQVMAHNFGVNNVACYSGGTEATAMFTKVAETLTKTGFDLTALSEGTNPVYSIKYADNNHPIIAFSKTYDNGFNPKSDFAAILTCSSADKGCPFIAGAEQRIPVMYDDPKAFDNTDLQDAKYLERSTQIATEMKYVFQQVIA